MKSYIQEMEVLILKYITKLYKCRDIKNLPLFLIAGVLYCVVILKSIFVKNTHNQKIIILVLKNPLIF